MNFEFEKYPSNFMILECFVNTKFLKEPAA